jgi:DNA recombination protein RmuC
LLEQECQNSKTGYDAFTQQANEWRDALNAACQENSALSERASRVSVLENDIANLLNEQKDKQQVLLSLTASEAEKAQSLQSKISRLTEVEQALANANQTIGELQKLSSDLRESSSGITAELVAERENLTAARNELQNEKDRREKTQAEVSRLDTRLAGLSSELEAEKIRVRENLALLDEAREVFSNQFKSLASDILEEKSKRFTEQNQTNIGQLLNPLKDRLIEFKNKVEEIHSKDTEQQATLKAELSQLKDLNRQMTEEAHGLATALKGQTKKQGNWGELVLGNVLDRCGLREGKDFKREVSFNTEDGRKRPDAIIYLPQSKHLVIDAKVSLNAYTRYVNSEDDHERQKALQEHVSAVTNRIQELSNRVYFELPGINSPEMVFMSPSNPLLSRHCERTRAFSRKPSSGTYWLQHPPRC